MSTANLFTNSAPTQSYTAVNSGMDGAQQSEGETLFQQASQSRQPDVLVKRQFEQRNQSQKSKLANEFIASAGREGISQLAATPDGQHALAVVYDHAGSDGRGTMRQVHEEQGNTAVDYTDNGQNSESTGSIDRLGLIQGVQNNHGSVAVTQFAAFDGTTQTGRDGIDDSGMMRGSAIDNANVEIAPGLCTPDNPYGLNELEITAVRYYFFQNLLGAPRLSTENFSEPMMMHLEQVMPQERDAWLESQEGPQMRSISNEEHQASIEARRASEQQKEDAVWRDSFHYKAAFSLQDAEMMAAVDVAFAPIAARIGQGLSKLYWGMRGEQAATNAALRTELRAALEADFKLYPGSAPTASVTILSADDVAQASARSAVTPNKFMYADGVAYRSDLKEHLAKFDGWPTTGKGNVRKTHVLGAHNMDEMYALEKTQGIHIQNKTKIGEGIYELEYWIPKKAGNGPLAGQVTSYSKAQYPKTVYDPKVFSDDRIIEMAQKAASTKYKAKAKVFESNPTRNQYSAIYDGVNFQVYLAKDKSGNIYVSNAHPAR